MKDYSFRVPQEVKFGVGILNKLPEILGEMNINDVMLVSDRGLEAIGVVKKVEDILANGGIKCTSYLDVKPNPSVAVVNEAFELFQKCGAKGLIALGGGSPMDVTKATGILAAHGGKINDYEGPNKVPGPIAPLVAIPTTAGTGSEATATAVITDEERNVKMSIFDYNILPKVAVLDPEMIMTAPASIAAATGVDALIHAMEAYVSNFATPFSDAMAEQAMQLIGRNLRKFVANRGNVEAASAMMAGSNFAGMSFVWAKLGNIHSMSHPVSAHYHVAHGVANAVLMPTVAEYNALADNGRYEKIYGFITGKHVDNFKPQMLVDELKQLNADLGLPRNLAAVGVQEEGIEQMAKDALLSGNVAANPRQCNLKEFIALYHKALNA